MDIREFYKSKQSNNQSSNVNQNTYNMNQNINSSKDFSEYQDTINKYKDLSQDELMSELLNQASDLKSQGKLNMDMLNQISNTLNPMLNPEQKQMLESIMSRLK